jgi:hypothetical protein
MNDVELSDKQQIEDAVESVHRYRDHAMWDKLSDYFVERPYINDIELTKEKPGIKHIKELIGSWRNELRNYFYATRHRVQSMSVSILGNKQATVESEVKGQYFINDKGVRYVLNVDGTYEYNLVKKSGRWKIGELKFNLLKQELKEIGQ